jgi:flagellar hook-basal body complex protein FliE
MHVPAVGLGAIGSEALSPLGPAAPKVGDGSFGSVIQRFVADTNAQQAHADQAVQKLATGQSESIHETMLAMAKADLSFRVFVEVQSKVVEAYQEVMRMPM